MGTLLLLDGFGGKVPEKKFLGGQLPIGRKVVRVWTDNFFLGNGRAIPLSGAHGGMIHLVFALNKYRGTPADPTIVLGWSRGCEIWDKTMREKGQQLVDAGVDPASVKAYMCGNPENKFTGETALRPSVNPPIYPGTKPHNILCPTPAPLHGSAAGTGQGIPNPMIWKPDITYIQQEFDGHADVPVDDTIPEIRRFFVASDLFNLARRVNPGPHSDYSRLLTDPTNVTYTDPTQTHVKYMWLRTYPMPSLAASQESPNWIRNEYERIYPLIQPGYSNRPVTLPMLTA